MDSLPSNIEILDLNAGEILDPRFEYFTFFSIFWSLLCSLSPLNKLYWCLNSLLTSTHLLFSEIYDELLQQDEVVTATRRRPLVIGFNKSWFIEILGKILNKLKMLVRFIIFHRVIYAINQYETDFIIISIHGKSKQI